MLDLGAGSGRHSAFLAEHGFDVTAVDIQPAPLPGIQPKPAFRTLQQDVRDYVPGFKYDIVIATMLLHFFSKAEGSKVIDKIKMATKIGGLNVLTVLTEKNSNAVRPHLFAENELRDHYQTGWKLLLYEECLGRPFFSKAKQRLVRQHRAALIAERILTVRSNV